jgi:hypothetical protein
MAPHFLRYDQSNYDLRGQKFRDLLGNKIERRYNILGITRTLMAPEKLKFEKRASQFK